MSRRRPGCAAQTEHADRLALAGFASIEEKLTSARVDHGDAAAALDFEGVVGADEGGGVLIETDADGERVVGQGSEQPAETIALAEVLVDDEAVGQAQARARAARCRRWPRSPRRRRQSCARSGCWRPRSCPPTVTPRALRARISLATGVPPSRVVTRSWLPPVKKMPGRLLQALQPARLPGSRDAYRSPSR